jgi:hypothetical protein
MAESESTIINALWKAHRKGFPRPLRGAIKAARKNGMTDAQIAGELGTTPTEVAALAGEQNGPA